MCCRGFRTSLTSKIGLKLRRHRRGRRQSGRAREDERLLLHQRTRPVTSDTGNFPSKTETIASCPPNPHIHHRPQRNRRGCTSRPRTWRGSATRSRCARRGTRAGSATNIRRITANPVAPIPPQPPGPRGFSVTPPKRSSTPGPRGDSYFSVELPGIEPLTKSPLSCGNIDFGHAKQRETTRNDLRMRGRC